MQIHIPDEPFRHSNYTQRALLLDVAVILYRKQVLNLVQATRLADRPSEEVISAIQNQGIALRESDTNSLTRRRHLLERIAKERSRWQHLQQVDVAAWVRQDRER
jgi:predicted HTH domain antitoxin